MDLQEFWNLVEPGKASEKPESSLKSELQNLSPEELEIFQLHFDNLVDKAYSWELWGAAYIIHGGCSDDGFIDFRYTLISKGKETYDRALADPDCLAKLGKGQEMENEMYGYVARNIYRSKVGKEIPRCGPEALHPVGQRWNFDDESENKKRLPKLSTIFG